MDGLGLREEIDDLLVRERLLDIAIIEVYNRVAVSECLSSDLVRENHFFFAIYI